MARKYVDFWINLTGEADLSEILLEIKKLGFKSVVVSSINDKMYEEFKKLSENYDVEVYRKMVLEPENRSTLLRNLRKYRGRFEVVTVICNNLEVALTAARDSRVDSLILSPTKRFRIDRGVAALISNCIELPFKWLIEQKSRRDFMRVVNEVITHLSNKTSIIVSSCASKPYELCSPHELASILQVFKIDRKTALDSVSIIPWKIIKTNLLKLSPNYIAKGVLKIG